MKLRSIALALLVALGGARNANAQLQPFSEEAALRGIVVVPWFATFGSGMALNDLDGDGDLDFVLTGSNVMGEVKLYLNDGSGFFMDASVGAGLPIDPEINGVTVADWDGDGLLDLYFTSDASDALFRNLGGLLFEDVSAMLNVATPGVSQGAVFADVNDDSWLDLYVPQLYGGDGPKLYLSDNGIEFVNVTASAGLSVEDDFTFQAQFFDYDRDGDQDLYLTRDDPSRPNRLYRNDGGSFVEVGSATGSDLGIDGMGSTVSDVNGDGFYDLYISDNVPATCRLLLSDGTGGFNEVASSSGFSLNARAWGVLFLDADNDGYSDVFTTTIAQQNYLHRGLPGAQFVDTTLQFGVGWSPGIDPGLSQSYTVTAGDIDSDGDLDLFVGSTNEPLALFVNPNGGSWLEVELRQGGANQFAVGASVRATDNVGRVQLQPIVSGTALRSSIPLRAHFGLGTATVVDQLIVTWPDGQVSVLDGVQPNQKLLVDRATVASFFDCNGNLIDDAVDLLSGQSSDLNSDSIPDECQSLFIRGDANGDGTRNIADAVVTLDYLFGGGSLWCLDAADANDSGAIDISDPLFFLSGLFGSGFGSFPPPTVSCGVDHPDHAAGDLGCEAPPGC